MEDKMISIAEVAGKIPDVEAASLLGCTIQNVIHYRTKNGIPPQRCNESRIPDIDTWDKCLKYLKRLWRVAFLSPHRKIIEDERFPNVLFEIVDKKYLVILTKNNGVLSMDVDRVQEFCKALFDIAACYGGKR